MKRSLTVSLFTKNAMALRPIRDQYSEATVETLTAIRYSTQTGTTFQKTNNTGCAIVKKKKFCTEAVLLWWNICLLLMKLPFRLKGWGMCECPHNNGTVCALLDVSVWVSGTVHSYAVKKKTMIKWACSSCLVTFFFVSSVCTCDHSDPFLFYYLLLSDNRPSCYRLHPELTLITSSAPSYPTWRVSSLGSQVIHKVGFNRFMLQFFLTFMFFRCNMLSMYENCRFVCVFNTALQ